MAAPPRGASRHTTIGSTHLADLADVVCGAVTRAGTAVLGFYGSEHVRLSAKPDRSPVTAADWASDELLQAALADLVPGCPVLSEERIEEWPPARRRGIARYWLVDPLDGTREFLAGNGEFCVCVALIDDGRPLLGVIHAPTTGVTYAAYAGRAGVVRSDRGGVTALPPRPAVDLQARGLRVGVSRRHGDAETAAYLAALPEPVPVPMGSALKFCAIAEGRLDLYPRFGPTMAWDTAAGQAIVEAAGRGVVTAAGGRRLGYRADVLTNPGFIAGV